METSGPAPQLQGRRELVTKTLEPQRVQAGEHTDVLSGMPQEDAQALHPSLHYLVLWISRGNKPLIDSKVPFQQTMKPEEGVLGHPQCAAS